MRRLLAYSQGDNAGRTPARRNGVAATALAWLRGLDGRVTEVRSAPLAEELTV